MVRKRAERDRAQAVYPRSVRLAQLSSAAIRSASCASSVGSCAQAALSHETESRDRSVFASASSTARSATSPRPRRRARESLLFERCEGDEDSAPVHHGVSSSSCIALFFRVTEVTSSATSGCGSFLTKMATTTTAGFSELFLGFFTCPQPQYRFTFRYRLVSRSFPASDLDD